MTTPTIGIVGVFYIWWGRKFLAWVIW